MKVPSWARWIFIGPAKFVAETTESVLGMALVMFMTALAAVLMALPFVIIGAIVLWIIR